MRLQQHLNQDHLHSEIPLFMTVFLFYGYNRKGKDRKGNRKKVDLRPPYTYNFRFHDDHGTN